MWAPIVCNWTVAVFLAIQIQGVPTEVIFLRRLSCSLLKILWGQHAHQIGALGWKFYLEMFSCTSEY